MATRQKKLLKLHADPIDAARAATLRYVNADAPGIKRKKTGSGFSYVDADGRVVRDKATLARIRSLVIPPAWTDVWICSYPNGHLQATGRDARGRKQYRYHPKWRVVRDETKYARVSEFAKVLPRIRRTVQADLRRPGMPREKVLAIIVRLLETTFIRVGNEEYAKANNSFGLTTMRNHHVRIGGSKIELKFRGKGGKVHSIAVNDRRLAKLVRKCRDLPGQQIFQYIDEAGELRPVDSGDVNDYLRETSGADYTAKDFRTWGGTLCAALLLGEEDSSSRSAIASVAERLGNTPAICKKCYIHPSVLEAFESAGGRQRWIKSRTRGAAVANLRAEERTLVRFLAGEHKGAKAA